MDYTLKDLLDIPGLQALLDSLRALHQLASSVIDPEGTILAASGWQRLCTEYHRAHPPSRQKCIENELRVGSQAGESLMPVIHRCPMGLEYAVTPIVIEGEHLANIFVGQIFTSSPDESYFVRQARQFGFDEDAYLAEMRNVPIFDEETLHSYLALFRSIANMLAEQGLHVLRQRVANEELRKSEKRHQTILQAALGGLCTIDMQGRLLEVNEAYCQKIGYSRQELLTMSIFDLEAAETPTMTSAHMRKIMEDGEGHFESRHRCKDGSVIDVEVNVRYCPEDGGQFIAFLRNITERKRAEALHRMGQDILLALNENEDMKEAIQRVLGLLRSATGVDAVGIRLQDGDDFPYFYQEGFPPDFLQKEDSIVARNKDGGVCRDSCGNVCLECTCGMVISGSTDHANPLFTPGGSAWTNDSFPYLKVPADQDPRTTPRDECIHQGYASIALIPIRAKGRIVGLLQLNDRRKGRFTREGIEALEDIAKNIGEAMLRKQAEEKLVASERFLRMLTNQLPGMVGYWDRDLRCRFANDAYKEWFGRSPEQIIGLTVQELMGEELFRLSEPYIRGALQGEPQNFERELVKPNGETGYTWAQYIPDMVNDKAIGFFVLISDVTELKRAEQEKAALEVQLMQAQKMESVGRLAGGVAHDFNNMLSVILGHTEMALLRMDPNQPTYASLREIDKAAQRSADLTRQLLGFARQQTVSPKVLNLNESISGLLTMLHRLIGENIRLQWQPAANLWQVRMDSSQIDQIMANLCVNAHDAIADVGEIIIETGNCTFDERDGTIHPHGAVGDYVRIRVSDNGSGMDKETRAHIFEPFFTTKEVGKGTGLGLATIYGIVKQNNGLIDVASEPDKGTTFSIYLPRFKGSEEPATPRTATSSFNRGNETVLLVEDEPAILAMTTEILTQLGYAVLQAPTPTEALRIGCEHKGEIHLLMTDVIMPEMNGRELAKSLSQFYPRIRCLYMSGYTSDIISPHGVLNDNVHFLQKPFDFTTLSLKLREVLD